MKIFITLFLNMVFILNSFSIVEAVTKEDLLFMEIPIVVTASKSEESSLKAPSVIYVIAAEEIRLSGAKSLADILKRVPGMRISTRESSLLGSRGFTSDQNDKFVFLIDGVPVTNIVQDGSYNFIDTPNLNMVERIEVLKGPGSTLWGSDASFGVVHIITKKGEDIGGAKTNFEYTSNTQQLLINYLYGNKLDNGEYMFSVTFTESDGYSESGSNGNDFYLWGENSDTRNPYLNLNATGIRHLDLSPSFEFYGKLRLGAITIKSRLSQMAQAYLWEYDESRDVDAVMKHYYTEIEGVKEFSENLQLTTKLSGHGMLYERGVLIDYSDPLAFVNLETLNETGISLESILNSKIASHQILVGAKVSSVEVGPSLRHEYVVGSGSTTLDGVNFEDFIIMNQSIDHTYGLYLEDNFDATEKLTLVAGLSYEYNDLREQTAKFMPRASIIYQLNRAWTAKALYNTGYNRPPAQKKFGRKWGFVEKSEEIKEYDLQFLYNSEKIHAGLTGFWYYIDNYFTWGAGPAGDEGHINKGDAESQGVELEFKYAFLSRLKGYLTWSYADTVVNDDKILGEPEQVYNFGLDLVCRKNISANLNINGWSDMYFGSIDGKEKFWSGIDEQIVDLNIIFDNFINKPLEISIYANNIFDNKVHLGMTGWPGYTYAAGVVYGTKISYIW